MIEKTSHNGDFKITIETNVSIPSRVYSRQSGLETNVDSDTSKDDSDFSDDSFEFHGSSEEGLANDGVTEPCLKDNEESMEKSKIKVLNEDKTDHRIGKADGNHAIKLTVSTTKEIRFFQLVTRYKVDENKEYNLNPRTWKSNNNERKKYSTGEDIEKSKELKKIAQDGEHDRLSHLSPLSWAVDCISKMTPNTEGLSSPYYDQPYGQSGIREGSPTDYEYAIYDEPEIWDIKSPGDQIFEYVLCKDKVKFLTFVVQVDSENPDYSPQVLSCIEWSRVGRPYIASTETDKVVKWSQIQKKYCEFFRQAKEEHTYLCDYKVKEVEVFNSPQSFPCWIEEILKNGDVLGERYDLKNLGRSVNQETKDSKSSDLKL